MQRKEKKGFDKKKTSGYIGEKREILRRKKGGTIKGQFWIKFQKEKREWEKEMMEKNRKKKERISWNIEGYKRLNFTKFSLS